MLDTIVDSQVLTEAVRLACRAPSLHNSQPWRWVAEAGRLDLYLDPTRAVHGDRSAREALISCGAVLDHLRVAMAAAGWTAEVDRFPDAAQPEHLASIGFVAADRLTELERYRAGAILTRHTDRLPFMAPANWEPFETVLQTSVEDPVRLFMVGDELRAKIAEASELAEALRLYDSSYHAELNWWTAPFEVSDGIPASALISAAESDGSTSAGRSRSPPIGNGGLRSATTIPRSCCCRPPATIPQTPWPAAKRSQRCCWNARCPVWRPARSRI